MSAAAHSSNMESPQTSDLLFEWLNDDYLFSPALLLMWCISLLRCLNNRVDISVETTQSSVMIANRSFYLPDGSEKFWGQLKARGSPHTTQWDALKVNPTVVTQFIPFQSVSSLCDQECHKNLFLPDLQPGYHYNTMMAEHSVDLLVDKAWQDVRQMC